MVKFWVFIDSTGESWQVSGELQDCIFQYIDDGGDLEDVVAIVSH